MIIRLIILENPPTYLVFKKNRKLKTDDISSVFNFRHHENGEFLRILYKPNQLHVARVAVVISKKIARHAVGRNYCKRVIRELFRTRQHQAGSLDLVILVKKKFSRLEFEKVAREFDLILSKISPAFLIEHR